ncbi:hypothetical protein [Martelella limonii]|uniref:hypothetical protein n=1 Tax=Martelella limonii TaxID=1647649 RepID=UPI0015806F62|nr:hypothetical protein [Martelella limonii]
MRVFALVFMIFLGSSTAALAEPASISAFLSSTLFTIGGVSVSVAQALGIAIVTGPCKAVFRRRKK